MARQGVPCVFPVVCVTGELPNGIASAVARRRPPNSQYDPEHLTVHEVERLIEVARANRYGERDALTASSTTAMASASTRIAAWEREAVEKLAQVFAEEGHRAREEMARPDHQASGQDWSACCGTGFFVESLRSLSLDRRKTMIDLVIHGSRSCANNELTSIRVVILS